MISTTFDEKDIGICNPTAYTPQLSLDRSRHLRRIAWAMKKPMTKAHAILIDAFIQHITRSEKRRKIVCAHCRDRTFCSTCSFKETAWKP